MLFDVVAHGDDIRRTDLQYLSGIMTLCVAPRNIKRREMIEENRCVLMSSSSGRVKRTCAYDVHRIETAMLFTWSNYYIKCIVYARTHYIDEQRIAKHHNCKDSHLTFTQHVDRTVVKAFARVTDNDPQMFCVTRNSLAYICQTSSGVGLRIICLVTSQFWQTYTNRKCTEKIYVFTTGSHRCYVHGHAWNTETAGNSRKEKTKMKLSFLV